MANCKIIRRLISFSLAACLVLGLAGCGNAGSSGSGKRFVTGKTPEETLETFFKALSRQDVNTMMACCYIEDYCDRVSFAQCVERLGGYMPFGPVSAPTEYDYYRNLAIYQQYATYAKAFQNLAFSLLAIDVDGYKNLLENVPIVPVDENWAVEFSREVNPKALADLKVVSIDQDCSERQNDPQYKENMTKSNVVDDCVERTVLLELNGILFYKGFTLAELNGRWQICAPNALLLGENPYGGATQVESAEEYRDIIQ